MDGTRSVGSPSFRLDPVEWRGMGEEWVDAVQRLGIPGRTLGMGGCGAEREKKIYNVAKDFYFKKTLYSKRKCSIVWSKILSRKLFSTLIKKNC